MPADALRRVHQLLPWWVVWADEWLHPLIAGVLCGVVALLLTVLVGFATRKAANDHWTERARAAWPPRCALGNFVWIGPALCLVMEFLLSGRWSPAPRWVGAALTGGAALLAVGMVACRYEQRLGRHLLPHVSDEHRPGFFSGWWWWMVVPLAYWLRGFAATMLVRQPHVMVMLVMVLALPLTFTWVTVVVIMGGAAVMIWLSSGGNLMLATWVGLARPAGERLQRIVDQTSSSVSVPAGPCYEVLISECNAYAFPLRGRMGFTTELLEQLSDEEVGVICAHELGHVAEGWGVRMARLSLVPVLAVFGAMLPIIHTYGIQVALTIVVVALLASRAVRKLARQMEHRADEYGHQVDEDQAVYAQALEKIYQANFVPAVISDKDVHPALYDRMLAAGVEPDYPRPDPPGKRLWMISLVIGVSVVCGWFLFRDEWTIHRLRQSTDSTEQVEFTTALASQDHHRAAAMLKLIQAERLQMARGVIPGDLLAVRERHRTLAHAAASLNPGDYRAWAEWSLRSFPQHRSEGIAAARRAQVTFRAMYPRSALPDQVKMVMTLWGLE